MELSLSWLRGRGPPALTVGMSALGAASSMGTNTPWSKSRFASPSQAMPLALSSSCTCLASLGLPGAGHLRSYVYFGKPGQSMCWELQGERQWQQQCIVACWWEFGTVVVEQQAWLFLGCDRHSLAFGLPVCRDDKNRVWLGL